MEEECENDRYPFFVEARLVEQLLPEARDRRYADPLCSFLEETGIGTITGGGTQLGVRASGGSYGIEYVALDIHLSNLDEAFALTKSKLTALGAPVGSVLEHTKEDGTIQSEPFGELELLNFFFDKIPDSAIHEKIALDALCDAIATSLRQSNAGELRDPVIFDDGDVVLYSAGQSADEMYASIQSLFERFPVLQKAQLVFNVELVAIRLVRDGRIAAMR